MDKPTKPTDLIPRSFGGVKNNFSQSLQSSGYEDGVPAIYGGDNLNYQLDATGKELDYCEKICDFINNIPIGNTITVDSNNKLIYEENKTARHVGEIVDSTIPLTDAGLHLLDGALIQGSGVYSAFVTHIAGLVTDYPDLFATESDWQTAVTTYGVCGKFVYDSVNNTVRLPKYGNQIITKNSAINTASTVPVIGNGKTLGLYDGNASGGLTQSSASSGLRPVATAYGANISTTGGSGATANMTTSYIGVTTNPNYSGIVATTSNLLNITNYSLDCYYYIVVATLTKTEIEVDIDEIATDLNGKADVDLTNTIGNWSSSSKNYVVTLAHELDWANAITVSTTSQVTPHQTYTPTNDGMMFLYSAVGSGSGNKSCSSYFYFNNLEYGIGSNTTSASFVASLSKPCLKNENVEFSIYATGGTSLNACKAIFIPYKKS